VKFILTLLAFSPFACLSQNLIPNGGFELQPLKPKSGENHEISQHWFSASKGTPDIIRQGDNMFGRQKAFDGEKYAGIILFDWDNKDYREYVEVKFLKELITGKEYCVRFRVMPGKSSYAFTDQLGVFLSKDSVMLEHANPIKQEPDFKTQKYSPLADTGVWKEIEYKFIAKGGERFLTIGNFRDDASTVYRINGGNTFLKIAYLYIDNVYLGSCETIPEVFTPVVSNVIPAGKLHIPGIITPNGDKFNDNFYIENLPRYAVLIITDKKGQEVLKTDNYKNDWEANGLDAGNYNFELKLPDGNVVYGSVDVVRKKN